MRSRARHFSDEQTGPESNLSARTRCSVTIVSSKSVARRHGGTLARAIKIRKRNNGHVSGKHAMA